MLRPISAPLLRDLNASHLAALFLLLGIAAMPALASNSFPQLEAYAGSLFARWGGALVFATPAILSLMIYFRQRFALAAEAEAIEYIEETIDHLKGSDGLKIREPFDRSGLAGRDENSRQAVLSTRSGQLTKRVFEDVKSLRFDPIASIVGAQRGVVFGWSTNVMSCQGIAVRAGILGTFFGLITALSDLPEILNYAQVEQSAESAVGMSDLVQSLSLAFGTSIAGLIAAMIIALLANAMRSDEVKLLTTQEQLASLVQTLCKNSLGDDDGIARTAKDLQHHLNSNREELVATRNAMQERSQDLRDAAETLTVTTKAPSDHIVGHMSDLSQLLERLRTTLQETAQLAGRVSDAEAKTARGLFNTLESVSNKQSEQVKEVLARQSSEYEASNEKLIDKLGAIEASLGGAIDRIVTNIDEMAKHAVQSQASVSLSEQSQVFENAAASAFVEQRAMLNRHGAILFALSAAGIAGVVGMGFYSLSVQQNAFAEIEVLRHSLELKTEEPESLQLNEDILQDQTEAAGGEELTNTSPEPLAEDEEQDDDG